MKPTTKALLRRVAFGLAVAFLLTFGRFLASAQLLGELPETNNVPDTARVMISIGPPPYKNRWVPKSFFFQNSDVTEAELAASIAAAGTRSTNYSDALAGVALSNLQATNVTLQSLISRGITNLVLLETNGPSRVGVVGQTATLILNTNDTAGGGSSDVTSGQLSATNAALLATLTTASNANRSVALNIGASASNHVAATSNALHAAIGSGSGGGVTSVPYDYGQYWNPTNAWIYQVPQSSFYGSFSNFGVPPLAAPVSFTRRGDRIWLDGVLGITGAGGWAATNSRVFDVPFGFGTPSRARYAVASVSTSGHLSMAAYLEAKQTNSIHIYAGEIQTTNSTSNIAATNLVSYADLSGSFRSPSGITVMTNLYGATNLTLALLSYPPPLRPKKAILYLHGNGSGPDRWEGDAIWNPNKTNMVWTLLANGVVVVAPRAAGNAWGSGLSYEEVIVAYQFTTNQFPTVEEVVIGANSMGNMLVGRLMTNSFFRRAYMIEPVLSLENMAKFSAFTNEIRSLYGYAQDFSDFAAKTSGFDPLTQPTNQLVGKTFWLRFSTSDTVVDSYSNSVAWATRFGVHNLVISTNATGDHGDLSHFNGPELLSFIRNEIP